MAMSIIFTPSYPGIECIDNLSYMPPCILLQPSRCSSSSTTTYTLLDVYRELDREFHFVTDAAADSSNRLNCRIFLTKEQNGLDYRKWSGATFINPPYSDPTYPVYEWVKAARDYNRQTGQPVVMLVRATPEVQWFQDFCWDESKDSPRPGVRIKFPRGRIKFIKVVEDEKGNKISMIGGANNGAPPFASTIIIF